MRINWLAILVALIAQQLLGFAWYTRVLFGEAWAAGIGKRADELAPAPGPFLIAIVAGVLLPLGLSWVMHRGNVQGIKAGAIVGTGVGVAFIAPAVLMHEAFLGYPPLVLMIDSTKEIVGALLVGAILGAWRR